MHLFSCNYKLSPNGEHVLTTDLNRGDPGRPFSTVSGEWKLSLQTLELYLTHNHFVLLGNGERYIFDWKYDCIYLFIFSIFPL